MWTASWSPIIPERDSHVVTKSGLFVTKVFKLLLLHVGKVISCDIPQLAKKSMNLSFIQEGYWWWTTVLRSQSISGIIKIIKIYFQWSLGCKYS